MYIWTGIDLPLDLVCGSLILTGDLYQCLRDRGHRATFFGLSPQGSEELVSPATVVPVLKGSGPAYVSALVSDLKAQVADMGSPDIIHAHHLGYGMSRALIDIDAGVPVICFAHGTDIYDAARSPAAALDASYVASHVDALVFPTVSLVTEALSIGLPL
jgi:hypothetical protein